MSDEWAKTTLGKVARVQSGFPFSAKDWTDSGTPVIKIKNVRDGQVTTENCSFISEPIPDGAERFLLGRGDLLITLTGEIGAIGFVNDDEPMYLNQRVGKVEIIDSSKADLQYVGLFLSSSSVRTEMWSLGKGNAQLNISPSAIHNLGITLPPLPVQRRIVDLMTHLDAHIANLQAEREAVAQVLTRTCDVPESKRTPLGERVRARGGKRMPKGEPFASHPTEHPYLRVVDMQDGTFVSEDLEYVPDEVWPIIKRYTVKEGELAISIVGTIGRVALVPAWADGANLTENAAVIDVLSPQLDVQWLGHWLQTDAGQREIERVTVGTTQGKLALSRIPLVEMPDISLNDQRRLAALADKTQTVCSRLSREVTALEMFRSRILAGMLSGQSLIPESYDSILSEVA